MLDTIEIIKTLAYNVSILRFLSHLLSEMTKKSMMHPSLHSRKIKFVVEQFSCQDSCFHNWYQGFCSSQKVSIQQDQKRIYYPAKRLRQKKFCQYSYQLKAVNYLRMKAPSQMFHRVIKFIVVSREKVFHLWFRLLTCKST